MTLNYDLVTLNCDRTTFNYDRITLNYDWVALNYEQVDRKSNIRRSNGWKSKVRQVALKISTDYIA